MTRRISNEAGEVPARLGDLALETFGEANGVEVDLPAREASEIRAKALQEALIAGEQSGEATPFDGEAFLARMNAKHGGGAK